LQQKQRGDNRQDKKKNIPKMGLITRSKIDIKKPNKNPDTPFLRNSKKLKKRLKKQNLLPV